jgi:hypothetical protein
MFCSLYKWHISQALDSEKPIAGLVKRHIRRCASCREFARFCKSLREKLDQDKLDLIKSFNKRVDKKIISSLDKKPEPRTVPPRKAILVPVAATALLIITVALGIIFLKVPRSNEMRSLTRLPSFNIPEAPLESMLVKIESPMDEEIYNLKQTVKSTGEYLISCLDFKIGERKE